MAENLDVFDWELGDGDMAALSSMAQCSAERGNRYDENCASAFGKDGSPGIVRYSNETGPTRTC